MDLKKLLKTYRQLLIYAGVIVVSVLCIVFGIFPLGEKTLAIWSRSSKMNDDISALKTKSATLESLDEATLKNNLLALTTAVPTDKSIGSIFSTLDGVAGNRVIMQDFQITKVGSIATDSAKKLSADEAKTGAHIIPFSVSVTGDLIQAQTFLAEVTAVRRLFNIRAVDISYFGSNVSVRVNLDAYYTPLPAAIGGFTKPITLLSDKEEATIAKMSSLPLQGSSVVPISTASAVPGTKSDPFSP